MDRHPHLHPKYTDALDQCKHQTIDSTRTEQQSRERDKGRRIRIGLDGPPQKRISTRCYSQSFVSATDLATTADCSLRWIRFDGGFYNTRV